MWPFGKSIKDRVLDNLKADSVMSGFGLQVAERGGVVSFSGQVPDERFVNLLSLFTNGIHGVRSVDVSGVSYPAPVVVEASEPVVAPEVEEKLQQVLASSALAKAVFNDIRADNELKDNPIDVLQHGSSVVLRGAVDSQHEFNLAVKLAQAVDGVSGVDSSDLTIVEGAKEKAKAEVAAAGGEPVNIPDEWHVVQSGDTLTGIAEQYYGDASKYKDLARANNILNPNMIKVGQKIQIPR